MRVKFLPCILLMVTLSSCSTFYETHYFKDKVALKTGQSNTVSNYYKVTIKGYSFLSSSRYVSGYFNQQAINLYFNEIKQPDNAKLQNTTVVNENQSLLTNEDGNELVLVFSTSAKAITDQIGNIAKNQTILNSMAQLTQKKEIKEALAIKSELSEVNLATQNFSLNTDLYLNDIDSKTGDEILNIIDQYIKSMIK